MDPPKPELANVYGSPPVIVEPYSYPPQSYPPQSYPPQPYPPQSYPPQPVPNSYAPNYSPGQAYPNFNISQNPVSIPNQGVHIHIMPNQNVPVQGIYYNQPIVVNQQPVRTVFGPEPVIAYCRDCKENLTTVVVPSASAMIWLICYLLFLFFPVLSIVPFFIKKWYDVAHNCPKCNRRVGYYNVMG